MADGKPTESEVVEIFGVKFRGGVYPEFPNRVVVPAKEGLKGLAELGAIGRRMNAEDAQS